MRGEWGIRKSLETSYSGKVFVSESTVHATDEEQFHFLWKSGTRQNTFPPFSGLKIYSVSRPEPPIVFLVEFGGVSWFKSSLGLDYQVGCHP